MLTFKRSFMVSAAVFAGGLAGLMPIHDAGANETDPFSLYGERIFFDVYRNDKRVGAHEVRFRRDGDQIVADSTFDLSIRFLGLFTYDYNYQSSGIWKDGKLIALEASVDDNGDKTSVSVAKQDNKLQIVGPDSSEEAAVGLFPTTHWNGNVVGATQIINTITGVVNNVTMVDKGRTDVPTGETTRPATHFAYEGDLKTEVWYDDDGRWVKMRFPGTDGTMIEYRCQVCGHTVAADGGPNLKIKNGG